MISLMSNRFWLSSIRSLPDPLWKDIKIVLTHNEGIKNFDYISRHLELEAERIDANNSAALVAKAGQCNEHRSQRKDSKRELDKEGLKRWGQKKAGKPFGNAPRASHLLELVHYDICGPMNVKARHGASYFITFIVDFSRFGLVFLLSHRSEVLNCLKHFVAEVENQKERNLKVFVLIGAKNTYLISSKLMMVQADLPKSFWGDALLTAAYVLNRVPSKSVSSTPYELWNGEKPNLKGLRPWGTAGHVHNTSHKHGKLGPRANKCVFIRYSEHSKGYVLLVSYSDADGSADRDERKSVSGYAFILGGGAITWCSKKQQCVCLSTMELEYVACTTANQEAIWLRRFLQSLSVTGHLGEAVVLHCDSTSAIAYARDPKYHGRTKHNIDTRYHFIRDIIAQGQVVL
ncbi:hypothetical protein RHSIM_RhsimUnG0017100 [Rhododendron simsii]|uniref:Retroviral polymerase SH3-like domain-containing protein n=1 Tax=Rhododendron simsii TaxID=118357 RepID=A0A834G3I0_RHOSS|nr:hypothetical protein RHSIM_RhsimUnG0017100 [Rhododendron simsii]